jgi:superfamily II DNA/RNA helicase
MTTTAATAEDDAQPDMPAHEPSAELDAAGLPASVESEPRNSAPEPEPEHNGFEALGLSPEVVRAVTEKGYRTPTPIQAQAIPSILMGRDVLGTAQTGTGKTGGFVLPMLDILSGARARARMPRSLILEPTRELALQVAENFVQYGKYLKLTHALLIGGESLSDQKEALMRGVDVLIATPGRLMDLFERGGLLLTDTSLLVIDEADRMLDMGFIPDVEKIVGLLPERRQTLFFSATMAPEIRRLADAFLREPKEIAVSRPASVATTIVAGLVIVDDLDKREALRRMIRAEEVQNALIFCNRKRDVDILYKSLKRHGFSVGAQHGDMSQPERFATLTKFRAGELRLLVCSDVAARGLDIGGLSHVFNFDVPIHAEDYVHRIGRTGRAGMTGHAYTLATPHDGAFVAAIEKLVGAPIPRIQVEGFAPLEFLEGDGKRRRGRARSVSKPVKPKAKAETLEDATAIAIPVPKRPRRGKAAPAKSAPAPMPVDTPQPELAETRPPPARDRDRRRERYRRDDDLGPPVLGFGDEVPAFMLLRARAKGRASAEVE